MRRLKKGERTHRKLRVYNIGDSVRFAKKNQDDTNIFFKSYGSTSRRQRHENWSKQVVKITDKKVVFGTALYKLPRQTKWRKSWELQPVESVRTLSIPKDKPKLPADVRKKLISIESKTPKDRMDKDSRNLVADLGAYWKPVSGRRKRKKVNYKV